LLQTKDETFDAFNSYANIYENNENNKRIRILATNNGTEYTNKRFKSLLDKKGITHQLSPVYTKEPNGLTERINRTIVNKIRCLLNQSNLPKSLWGKACCTAAYLYNRSPHSSLESKTLYELKYGKKPDISRIKTFGSICYYKNKGNNIKKLDDKALKGILVRFDESLYKVYNPNLRKCIWVRDIHILENKFLEQFLQLEQAQSSVRINIGSFEANPDNTRPLETREKSLSTMSNSQIIDIDNDINELESSVRDQSVVNNSLKLSKSQSASIISNAEDEVDELALFFNVNKEPNTYKQAIMSEKNSEWQKDMKAEIDELVCQNTWELTELPKNKVPLRGRWVYKLKTDLNDEIIKYKARWVVKGFNQVPGADYSETFSSTCRPESYRLIFMLAIHNNWSLNQATSWV
ncbi:hypothetical protein K3495_g15575, partial [Podosphaera aphanis]